MRRVIVNFLLLFALLLATSLWTGCVQDTDDESFFYRGWGRPKLSPDDRAYFYGGKSRRGAGPEEPRLPSGELPR